MIKDLWDKLLKKDEKASNDKLKKSQNNLLLIVFGLSLIMIICFILIIQNTKIKKAAPELVEDKIKIEVGAKSLDPDKMWRNHFEENLRRNKQNLDKSLSNINEKLQEKEKELLENTKGQISKLQAELLFAKEELASATLELRRAANLIEENQTREPETANKKIEVTNIDNLVEYDHPKSATVYVPETSYVAGYLLGGIAVSTSINAPSENATPVVIKLVGRGNLPRNFKVNVDNCRILGSSYGDLSSERAVIRAEKLICIDPSTEFVTTSNIAGVIHGPDGMNGIKGKVIATNNRHIQNAMIGGVLSGLSSVSKGQDNGQLTSFGAISTGKKTVGKLAGDGILSGTSSAAERVADYYLKMAESMSPILTIPGGVKVDVVFIKGFFIGELSTHKKISQERKENKRNGWSENE